MKVKNLLKEATYNNIGNGGLIVYIDPKTKKFYLERKSIINHEVTLFDLKDWKKLKRQGYEVGFDMEEYKKHFSGKNYTNGYATKQHISEIINKMKNDALKYSVKNKNGE
jgi:hypothetical protein